MRLTKSVTRTRDYFIEAIADGSAGYCTATSGAEDLGNKKTSAWEVFIYFSLSN